MKSFQFVQNPADTHYCVGHKEGDWVIFTCPLCRDYERRLNWKTGKLSQRGGNSNFSHKGFHAPVTTSLDAMSAN